MIPIDQKDKSRQIEAKDLILSQTRTIMFKH